MIRNGQCILLQSGRCSGWRLVLHRVRDLPEAWGYTLTSMNNPNRVQTNSTLLLHPPSLSPHEQPPPREDGRGSSLVSPHSDSLLARIPFPPSPEPPEAVGELPNIGIAIALNCSREEHQAIGRRSVEAVVPKGERTSVHSRRDCVLC